MVLDKKNAKWDWGSGLWKGRKEWDQNEILNEATNSSLQLDVRIFSLHHWHRNVLCGVRHVTPAQVPTISPKNVSNLPTSLVVSRREGRPRDRGCECILLLCLIL